MAPAFVVKTRSAEAGGTAEAGHLSTSIAFVVVEPLVLTMRFCRIWPGLLQEVAMQGLMIVMAQWVSTLTELSSPALQE